jgi:phosphinothricin acetyltransferase
VTVQLRRALPEDLTHLTTIYNWYVEQTNAIFDEAPATTHKMQRWFNTFMTSGAHQLLVADSDAEVVGYASSSRYRQHPAFADTVETSIYLHPKVLGLGLGGRLYDALLEELQIAGVHLAVAGVALPNDASVALHRSRGFREVGTFTEYALKRGQRVSSTWFEKLIHP